MNAASKLSAFPAIGGQPVIRTERLVLRAPRRSDAGLLEQYTSDRRLAEGTRTIPHPLPPGATQAWLARAMGEGAPVAIPVGEVGAIPPGKMPLEGGPDPLVWVIDGSDSGLAEVLGIVSLHHVSAGQSELEFWIGPGFWNTGFATEAVAGLIEANPCDSRSMVAEAFQDNPGSARVLTNCGFDYLGDAESWSVARNARVPTWTYARAMG